MEKTMPITSSNRMPEAPAERPLENLARAVLSLPLEFRISGDGPCRIADFHSDEISVSVEFLSGNVAKTSLEFEESGVRVRAVAFFDGNGIPESARTWRRAERTFDNGVRRGPDRRSLHCRAELRQDFAPDGAPKTLGDDYPDSVAGIHIHTVSYVAGSMSECANSFLGYSFDAEGVVPSGFRIPDMTHFHGKGRVSIREERVASGTVGETAGAAASVSENGASVSAARASEGTLPYRVRLFEEAVEISMAGETVAAFETKRVFDSETLLRLLGPHLPKTAGTFARSVRSETVSILS